MLCLPLQQYLWILVRAFLSMRDRLQEFGSMARKSPNFEIVKSLNEPSTITVCSKVVKIASRWDISSCFIHEICSMLTLGTSHSTLWEKGGHTL
jgi:hypothetical protein